MNRAWAAMVVLGVARLVLGDTLVLTDGTRLEGELRHVDNGWDVVKPDGSVVHVLSAKVVSIQRGTNTASTPGEAMERFSSLKRSLEIETDPARAIDRYRKFIDQNADPAADQEAEKELKLWTDRQENKLVKFGKTWITPAQRSEKLAQSTETAQQARLMIKDNRLSEAELALSDVLAIDPQNISALYLMGYLNLRTGKIPEARKYLTTLSQILPDHPPTLYDLGLVLMKQKQWGPALGMLDKTLTVAPGNRFVVDNIAEVLNQVPDEERRSPAYQKLAKRFALEEAAVVREMAKQKMYRWGSGWVDQPTHDKLVAAENEIRKKMAEMETQFAASRSRLAEIDQSITRDKKSMDDIEATSWYRMPDGTVVRTALPAAYYDIGREIDRLREERTKVETDIARLQAEARGVQAQLPQPKYTGNIELINEDGVPIILPASTTAPTTAPSTQPTTQPGSIDVRIGPADVTPH